MGNFRAGSLISTSIDPSGPAGPSRPSANGVFNYGPRCGKMDMNGRAPYQRKLSSSGDGGGGLGVARAGRQGVIACRSIIAKSTKYFVERIKHLTSLGSGWASWFAPSVCAHRPISSPLAFSLVTVGEKVTLGRSFSLTS